LRLVLASGSPQRAALLDQLGLVYEVRPADVDESRRPGESAGDYVERLAREKALSVVDEESVVIGADTAIAHEGHIVGKPAHPAEARGVLSRLQASIHEVFTGVAVASGTEIRSLVDVTDVTMMAMTDEEIAEYVDSGEPMEKAGSYALQGWGGVFVESISGSPFTVIGLPIHLLPRLFAQTGTGIHYFKGGRPV
jgi:septum formation protein